MAEQAPGINFANILAGLLGGGPVGGIMAGLGDPAVMTYINNLLKRFKGPGRPGSPGGGIAPGPQTFAGRPVNTEGFAGVQGPLGAYGHTIRPGGGAEFTVPGAGGGTVDVSNLARGAAGGGEFERTALARQAESAGRFSRIDQLIEQLGGGPKAGPFQDVLERALGRKGAGRGRLVF